MTPNVTRSEKTFTPTRMLVVCCTCLFLAGLASAQVASTPPNTTVGNVQVNSRISANAPSTQVEVQVNSGQQHSRFRARASNGTSSALRIREAFDGDLGAFSPTNASGNPAGFGTQASAIPSPRRGRETDSMTDLTAKDSEEGSQTAASAVSAASSPGWHGEGEAEAGHFPDATRELFWPSPPLYSNSDPFQFRPKVPVWSPQFGKIRHLNPSYLVNGTMVELNKRLSGGTRRRRSSPEFRPDAQLVTPLSQLNSTISSGENLGPSKTALGDILADPLYPGN